MVLICLQNFYEKKEDDPNADSDNPSHFDIYTNRPVFIGSYLRSNISFIAVGPIF